MIFGRFALLKKVSVEILAVALNCCCAFSRTGGFGTQDALRSETQSDHVPFQFARTRFGFPEAFPAEECIFISPALNPLRQSREMVHKAAAQQHIIGDEGFLQLPNCIDDFVFPFFLRNNAKPGMPR